MRAYGTYVVTSGKHRRPVANYFLGWFSHKYAAQEARRVRDQSFLERPIRVVRVTPENCLDLIATPEHCFAS